MTKSQSKLIAYNLAATLLDADRQQDSWLLECISAYFPDDQVKIQNAMESLVEELLRRSKGIEG